MYKPNQYYIILNFRWQKNIYLLVSLPESDRENSLICFFVRKCKEHGQARTIAMALYFIIEKKTKINERFISNCRKCNGGKNKTAIKGPNGK